MNIQNLCEKYNVDTATLDINILIQQFNKKYLEKPTKTDTVNYKEKSSKYYQPSSIESLFMISESNPEHILFDEMFDKDEYIDIINKITTSKKISKIQQCLNKLNLKFDFINKLSNFKDRYSKKAMSLNLDDDDEASEIFTKAFISCIKNDFEKFLNASMRKLKSHNDNNGLYAQLSESIISYLKEVGFFVPKIETKYSFDVPIWNSSEIITTYTDDKKYHEIICDIERFPYLINYYDDGYGEISQMGILGSCKVYSINAK